MPSDNDYKLTFRQRRFVEEYAIDGNATQAALRSGYSRRTARQIGYENLTKPYINAAIERKQAESRWRTEVTKELVLDALWGIAQNCDVPAMTRLRALMNSAKIMGYLTHRHATPYGPVYHRHVDTPGV